MRLEERPLIFDSDWSDLEFVVANLFEIAYSITLADHLGDVKGEYQELLCGRNPGQLSDDYPKPPDISARDRETRYQAILIPILAKLPCYQAIHGDLEEDEIPSIGVACGRDGWDRRVCPSCWARFKLKREAEAE